MGTHTNQFLAYPLLTSFLLTSLQATLLFMQLADAYSLHPLSSHISTNSSSDISSTPNSMLTHIFTIPPLLFLNLNNATITNNTNTKISQTPNNFFLHLRYSSHSNHGWICINHQMNIGSFFPSEFQDHW